MISNKHVIRLIFGMKVRELRKQRGLSFSELSKASGLSVSYLNEIERGKKYPKSDKILALAGALDVSYDHLVSLKLNKKLSPVADLLRSPFFQELPLEFFGLEAGQLMELIANAPTKINAFISTLIEIARNYEMQQEQFYFAAVRSYQELHDSHFPEIEEAVDAFAQRRGLDATPPVSPDHLEALLREVYGYRIDRQGLAARPELSGLRSLYQRKRRTLMINPQVTETQRAFLLARELAFNELALKTRPVFTPGIEAGSFEEALNNFKASYFAVALLLNRQHLVPDLERIFELDEWTPSVFTDLLDHYRASPEMLIQRLTNLLPKHFGLRNLFLLRFRHDAVRDQFRITKELHLAKLHSPHANEINEHYCRRWVSLSVLKELEARQRAGENPAAIADFQRSSYVGSREEYLILSLARPNAPSPGNVSVSLGIQIDERLRRRVAALSGERIPLRTVNETCERCPLADCAERAAPPTVIERDERRAAMRRAVDELIKG